MKSCSEREPHPVIRDRVFGGLASTVQTCVRSAQSIDCAAAQADVRAGAPVPGTGRAGMRGYAPRAGLATRADLGVHALSLLIMTSDIPEARQPGAPVYDATSTSAAVAVDPEHTLHRDVLAREKEEFGGFKFGTAFFGWLTATGTVVILGALVAAIFAALGLSTEANVDEAVSAAADNALLVGIVGSIVLGLVLFVAYFAGGYVAGRMARFSGVKQGIAVWIWAVAIAIIVAIITAVAGSQWDILANLDSLPRIPVTDETATLTTILTALGAAVVTLLGAVLGGLTGMRYHRRVDRIGLGR